MDSREFARVKCQFPISSRARWVSGVSVTDRMLPQLTLVLPVRDRPWFAARFFDYLERVDGGAGVKVLVGDGSLSSANAESYRLACERPELDVEYHRFPADAGHIQFGHKLLEMSRQVGSEFCCLVSDDDFPVVSNLHRAVQTLADSEASAWMGETIDFDVVGSRRRGSGLLRISPRGRECGGRYTGRRSAAGSVSERLRESANVYPAGALLRTEVLRGAVTALWEAEVHPLELMTLLSYQMLLSGTVLSDSPVVAFRQDNTPGSYGGVDTTFLFQRENLAGMRRAISNLNPPPDVSHSWQEEVAWDYADWLSRRALRHLTIARSSNLHGWLQAVARKSLGLWAAALPANPLFERGFKGLREDLKYEDPCAADSLDLIRDVLERAKR